MVQDCSRCRAVGGAFEPVFQAVPEDAQAIEMLGRLWFRCPECARVREAAARTGALAAVAEDVVTPAGEIAVYPVSERDILSEEVVDSRDVLEVTEAVDTIDDEVPTLPGMPPFDFAAEPRGARLGHFLSGWLVAAALLSATFGLARARDLPARSLVGHLAPARSAALPALPALVAPTQPTQILTPSPVSHVREGTLATHATEPAARPAPSNEALSRHAAREPKRAEITPVPCELASAGGAAAMTKGDYEAAKGAYAQALTLNPRFLPARVGLADATWESGDHEAAQKMYAALVDDGQGAFLSPRARERAEPPPVDAHE